MRTVFEVDDSDPNFGVEVRQSDALATLKAFRNARAASRAGVTTVRDLSANGTTVIDLGRFALLAA